MVLNHLWAVLGLILTSVRDQTVSGEGEGGSGGAVLVPLEKELAAGEFNHKSGSRLHPRVF